MGGERYCGLDQYRSSLEQEPLAQPNCDRQRSFMSLQRNKVCLQGDKVNTQRITLGLDHLLTEDCPRFF